MYGPFGRQFITQSESGVLEANCTITVSDIGMSRRPPTGLYFKPSDVTIAGACGAISSDWWAATAGEHQQTRHRYVAARNTFQLHDRRSSLRLTFALPYTTPVSFPRT